MNRRTFSRAALSALVLSASGSHITQAASTSGTSSVYPEVGAPGDQFSFIASGFAKDEIVGIWINRPDGRVSIEGIESQQKATQDGRVSWGWQAPNDAALGFWQMVAQGSKSGRQVVLSFELRKQAPQQAASNITPSVGRGGTLFIFYASGFIIDEYVGIWANTPAGKAIEITPDRWRNYLGRVDGSWSAPIDAQLGPWQIVLYGEQSRITQVLNFRIEAPSP